MQTPITSSLFTLEIALSLFDEARWGELMSASLRLKDRSANREAGDRREAEPARTDGNEAQDAAPNMEELGGLACDTTCRLKRSRQL